MNLIEWKKRSEQNVSKTLHFLASKNVLNAVSVFVLTNKMFQKLTLCGFEKLPPCGIGFNQVESKTYLQV